MVGPFVCVIVLHSVDSLVGSTFDFVIIYATAPSPSSLIPLADNVLFDCEDNEDYTKEWNLNGQAVKLAVKR